MSKNDGDGDGDDGDTFSGAWSGGLSQMTGRKNKPFMA